MLQRGLSLLLCITIILTGIPIQADAAGKKFIKAEPTVFVPSAGEKAKITFNLEKDRLMNVMIMQGDKVIDYLAKDVTFEGKYKPHELTWDGRDTKGTLVKNGTYQVVAQPQEEGFQKYKSITTITAVKDNTKDISVAAYPTGSTFYVYGKGGKKQGVSKVNLTYDKNGSDKKTISATIGDNLWYVAVPMSAYTLYNLSASVTSSSGNSVKNMTALRHVYRVTDRMEYLAGAYYDNYKKDTTILNDNNLTDLYTNDGEQVNSNILILNPTGVETLKVQKEAHLTKQHLGIIDQLQRTASENPVSLSMGNNFYANEDIAIDGFLPLSFTRMYNSLSHSFHELGMAWSHSFSYYLQDLGNTVAIQFEDGHLEYYTKSGDGYTTAEGLVRTLVKKEDGSFHLTVDKTDTYHFDATGKLLTITDLNGNNVNLTYADGMLKKAESLSGYLNFNYNTDGSLKNVVDGGGRTVRYTYTKGELTGFTNVNGYKTTYSYDSYGRLAKIVSAEGVTLLEITYDSSDRVITKSVLGGKYSYSYDDAKRTITCTEPNNNKIIFHYSKEYRIESEEYSDGTKKYYYKEGSKEATDYDSGILISNTAKVALEKNTSSQSLLTQTKNLLLGQQDGANAELAKTAESLPSVKLELETHNMNTATGSATNNTLYPQYRIHNTGTTKVNLSDITLRYYYTIDGERPQNFFTDWFSAGPNTAVTGKFYKLTVPKINADYYVEVGFTSAAGELEPGKSIETHTRIGKDDWSVFTPGNDYSQNMDSGFTYFDQVDMFYKGNLVWGKGSIGSGVTKETPTVPQPTPTIMPTTPVTPTPILESDYQLIFQMYNTGNSGDKANTIHPMMRLINTGKEMVKYSDITIRYYYTTDDEKIQNFWCDWSSAGQQNITGTFHKLDEKYEGADTYLEVGFREGSGYLGIGALTDLHIRIAKNDWTNYDLTNDYSLRAADSFADWD